MNGDKGLRCWGDIDFGQLGSLTFHPNGLYFVPATNILTDVEQASGGEHHTCAVVGSTRQLYCLGRGDNGQLGLGDEGSSSYNPVPKLVPFSGGNLTGVQQIEAGARFTCVLLIDNGAVKCWGLNDYGQLGDGTTSDRNTVPVGNVITGALQVSCGQYHCCVIIAVSNAVKCWGDVFGALGTASASQSLVPSADVIVGAVMVSAGALHTCVVLGINGGLRCWGFGGSGALGMGDYNDINTPLNVDVLSGIRSVSAGLYHTCAVNQLNELRCWGYGVDGALGIGPNDTYTSLPPPAPIATGVVQLSSHLAMHSCVVMSSATLDIRCWGSNGYGQLGNGGNINVDTFPTTGITVP